jgi:hypothetical protein
MATRCSGGLSAHSCGCRAVPRSQGQNAAAVSVGALCKFATYLRVQCVVSFPSFAVHTVQHNHYQLPVSPDPCKMGSAAGHMHRAHDVQGGPAERLVLDENPGWALCFAQDPLEQRLHILDAQCSLSLFEVSISLRPERNGSTPG